MRKVNLPKGSKRTELHKAKGNMVARKTRWGDLQKTIGIGTGGKHAESEEQLQERISKLKHAAFRVQESSAHKAIQYYTEIISLQSKTASVPVEDRAQSMLNRAILWRRLRDFPHALRDLEAANLLDPKNPRVFAQKGEILLKLRQFTAASETFLLGLHITPHSDRMQKVRSQCGLCKILYVYSWYIW